MFKKIILVAPLIFCQQAMATTTSFMMSANIIRPVALHVNDVDFGTVIAPTTAETLHKTGTYSVEGDDKAVHLTVKPMMREQENGVSFHLSLSNGMLKSSKVVNASANQARTYYASLTIQPNAKAGEYHTEYEMTATYY